MCVLSSSCRRVCIDLFRNQRGGHSANLRGLASFGFAIFGRDLR